MVGPRTDFHVIHRCWKELIFSVPLIKIIWLWLSYAVVLARKKGGKRQLLISSGCVFNTACTSLWDKIFLVVKTAPLQLTITLQWKSLLQQRHGPSMYTLSVLMQTLCPSLHPQDSRLRGEFLGCDQPAPPQICLGR